MLLYTFILEQTNDIPELQKRFALHEDLNAYEALYRLFFPRLQNFCFSIVKSKEVAEEIVSDVFVKLWEVRIKLTEIYNLKVYLYTIAKNLSVNYLNKHDRHPIISINGLKDDSPVILANPEELCITSDIVHKIQQAIRQLPPQCSLIFQMVKKDGLKYKEVAQILHISTITVRNQMAIAIRKLAESLPGHLDLDTITLSKQAKHRIS